MQSKATTVDQYLAALPEDRRAALEAVRKVILKNLDKDYEEGMQYGMIGYYVPHRVYPAGYHCDPKQPLPMAGLASQKGHMSLYMMCLYMADASETTNGLKTWFDEAWKKSGKKLDMGKACIRFKRVEDLALDVIGETFRRVTAKKYIATMEAALAQRGGGKKAGGTGPGAKKPTKRAVKKASTKVAKKTAKK